MVAVLTRLFGTENLELVEDVVQDTLLKAMQTWSFSGVPSNPVAWLYKVARNSAIDIIRRNRFAVAYDFNDPERVLLQSEYTLHTYVDNLWHEDVIQDDLLRMMFACCHPELSQENQITLILKTLCGFSTSEIAKSLLTSEDTISKRLYRTKSFFREQKIRPEFPAEHQLKQRLDSVLRTIYLIFNEGYNSTHSDLLIRKDLLEQALYLCNLLCSSPLTAHPEVHAAMALMLFHVARIAGRTSTEGAIILLHEQDRTTWDKALIEQGNVCMHRAATGDVLSTYHVEAAIAYEHCIAERFEDTNWQRILDYYNVLVSMAPSVVVKLNRIAVIHRLHGNQAAVSAIESESASDEFDTHYLFHSLLGEIHAKSDIERARSSYARAMALTQSSSEKALLQRKIEALTR